MAELMVRREGEERRIEMERGQTSDGMRDEDGDEKRVRQLEVEEGGK